MKKKKTVIFLIVFTLTTLVLGILLAPKGGQSEAVGDLMRDLVLHDPLEDHGMQPREMNHVINQTRGVAAIIFEEKVALEILWINFHGVPLVVFFMRFLMDNAKIYTKGTFLLNARAHV